MVEASRIVEIGRTYRHYRNGKLYEVLFIGRLTESSTLEECVIYKALYEDPKFGKNAIWIRPLANFLEGVEVDGHQEPRFQLFE